MERKEITEVETEFLLGTDSHMIIQNITGNHIYWSVDADSTPKFRLKKHDTIIVDYDVYLTSDGHGQEYVTLGRL